MSIPNYEWKGSNSISIESIMLVEIARCCRLRIETTGDYSSTVHVPIDTREICLHLRKELTFKKNRQNFGYSINKGGSTLPDPWKIGKVGESKHAPMFARSPPPDAPELPIHPL